MVRKLALVAALVLGLASAMLVASCGGDSTEPSIPRADAEQLLADLQQVQDNFDVRSCTVAASYADTLVQDVQQLPGSVDSDLRQALENGAEQLQLLLEDPKNCESPTETETTTENTDTQPTETQPTETQPTETTPTETTPTETTPTEPTTTTGGGSGGIGL